MTQQSQIEFGSESSRIYTLINNLIEDVDRTTALIEDPELRNRFVEVLDNLDKLDKNLTADVMVS